MIIAGIDEAGYGPRLGPLVVACTAFRADEGLIAEGGRWPSWSLDACEGVGICDSKVAYARGGLRALERSVFASAASLGEAPGSLEEFLETFAIEGGREALSRAWYSGDGLPLPTKCAPGSLGSAAGGLSRALEALGMRFVGARLAVVDAVRYNEIVERVGNKATLLFGRASILMEELWRESGGETVYLTVDRHGGRKFYGGLLDVAFPHAGIEVLAQEERESSYRLTAPGGGELFVRFVVGGESVEPATALASMWAKYTRELFMELFNRYWRARAEVRATAGYWEDAGRFLEELVAAGVLGCVQAAPFVRTR